MSEAMAQGRRSRHTQVACLSADKEKEPQTATRLSTALFSETLGYRRSIADGTLLTQFLQRDSADSLQRNFVKGITKIEICVGAGHRNFFQSEIFQRFFELPNIECGIFRRKGPVLDHDADVINQHGKHLQTSLCHRRWAASRSIRSPLTLTDYTKNQLIC